MMMCKLLVFGSGAGAGAGAAENVVGVVVAQRRSSHRQVFFFDRRRLRSNDRRSRTPGYDTFYTLHHRS